MPQASPQQSFDQIRVERQRLEESNRRQLEQVGTHVKAIADIRAALEVKIGDLQRECEALQRVLRRSSYEDVSRYMVYQAAQMRVAGVLSQGLKRATAADKYLEASRIEREERAGREHQEELRRKLKAVREDVARLQLPQEDDFETLYEGVTDAS